MNSETQQVPGDRTDREKQSLEYCDIDEGRVRGFKKAAADKLVRQQDTIVADADTDQSRINPVTELFPLEVNDGKKTYENVMDWNSEPLYDNRIPAGIDSHFEDGDSSGTSGSDEEQKTNCYLSLDASNKEHPGPPSVYKRLKNQQTDERVEDSRSSVVPRDLVPGVCRGKPKLLTPESSDSSN